MWNFGVSHSDASIIIGYLIQSFNLCSVKGLKALNVEVLVFIDLC